jgi:hypothetical protein
LLLLRNVLAYCASTVLFALIALGIVAATAGLSIPKILALAKKETGLAA